MSIDNMQFGFIMPGKGTIDLIFIMHEKHLVKKKVYYAFVDLEK